MTDGEMFDRSQEQNGGKRRRRDRASGRAQDAMLARGGPVAAVLSLQRAAGNAAVAGLVERSPIFDVIARPAPSLGSSIRRDMEQTLGHDFSDVRVHTGTQAAESARSVGATAYTVGSNVVLGDGASLAGSAGRGLLAHELTHVVQQRQGPVDGTPAPGGIKVSDPSDRFEREADEIGRQVSS